MYLDKTIKLNKKVKLKSLKQVLDKCLESKFDFCFDENFLTVSDKDFNEISFKVKEFGEEVTVKSAVLEFHDDGKIMSEFYDIKKENVPPAFGVFFTNFPKLTKEQKTPLPTPPPPAVLNELIKGEGHLFYDFKYLDNGTVEVGCHTFNKKQVKKIFNFLGECLGYDVEN